ncbi:hypothetical protein [Candidatus Halobonum tyrrellensis]|uniref:Antibiotic ABC transporter permease n=1 Tax=Candidatus Halobonum tyrrellensis G22 TaxID=1324957 RepID=V4GND8_9EURY|nr:hypothetical protein [Candidatus Halobonum tyrrellensis]ESP86901.1 hypothetical protein K933_16607 [Candidatus Halobonum tyrrellensis G22]
MTSAPPARPATPPDTAEDRQYLVDTLDATLTYARDRDYTGWDYGDGMSSRLLQRLPVDNKWVNAAVQEGIKRSPVNVRPLFRVERRRNYKGTALFTMANLGAAELAERGMLDPDPYAYRAEARDLADWLVEHRIRGHAGFCGGHRHSIQWRDRVGTPQDPDVVSTVYAVKALLAAADELEEPRYEEAVRSAADFIYEDLAYHEVDDTARIKYVPAHGTDNYTLNAVALGAVLLLELHERFDEERHLERARKLLDYVVSRQEPVGGWRYRDPPDSSHLSMDNHHNGFVVESLLRYRTLVGDDRYADALDSGLDFYREQLFEPDGAPNWDERKAYPRDTHAAAQGIIVFSKTGELDRARRVLSWTLAHLHAGDGRFYFRQDRYYTRRFTLMRWCQAWMSYATATYLLAPDSPEPTPR